MKTIHDFRVLHDGWEMDNRAWIMEDDNGERILYTTNHGVLCKMTNKELLAKIRETENSLADLKTAAKLMGNS
jgi:hypothetical protein